MPEPTSIEVYPVGFYRDLRVLRARLRDPQHPMTRRQKWRAFFRAVRWSWPRRTYWNGYLAEIHYPPEGLLHRKCGRGWTRRGALHSLGVRLYEDNRRQVAQ